MSAVSCLSEYEMVASLLAPKRMNALKQKLDFHCTLELAFGVKVALDRKSSV